MSEKLKPYDIDEAKALGLYQPGISMYDPLGLTLSTGSHRIEAERILDLLPDEALPDVLGYLGEVLAFYPSGVLTTGAPGERRPGYCPRCDYPIDCEKCGWPA